MIRTLMENFMEAGNYSVTWNGRNETGAEMNSGLYIFSIEADHKIQTKKMLFLR